MNKPIITPQTTQAVLFDLDGVITDSASIHANAWKTMFDEFLYTYSTEHNYPYVPFSITNDYVPFVDGKPRYEGVAAFLESRRIVLPWGEEDDEPSHTTICGLGNQKNVIVQTMIAQGVTVYDSTVAMIDKLIDLDIPCAVVSSSRNAVAVLTSVNLLHKFVYILDGNTAAKHHIAGKPEPDTFLACADKLNVNPAHCVVVEDAISGVQAGYAGEFGLVIGVAREQNKEELLAHGANLVVGDLAEILDYIGT